MAYNVPTMRKKTLEEVEAETAELAKRAIERKENVTCAALDAWPRMTKAQKKKIGAMLKELQESCEILKVLMEIDPEDYDREEFKKKYPKAKV